MRATGLVVTLGKDLYAVESPWGSLPRGKRLDSISEVAVDAQDRLYVFQRTDPPVVVFDRTGRYLTSWGVGTVADAHGIYISSDDRIFLVDRDAHQVLGFDLEGRLEITLGERHRPRLQAPFNHPTDVAIGTDGSILVADGYANAAVHCFWPNGELRWTRGRPGSGPGEFITPHGIWVARDGRVLVADRENNRIQVLDSGGEYIEEWAGLYRPMDIFVDGDDQIYVTEQVPRLSLLSPRGVLLGRCRTQLVAHGVWADSRGDIYLAEVPDKVSKLVRLAPVTSNQ
jgi:peptidylglycine monooxygenase